MAKNESPRGKKSEIFKLDGAKINSYTLSLRNVKRGRFVDEKNFNLYLQKAAETGSPKAAFDSSLEPVIIGTYFEGRGQYLNPWLEVFYRPVVQFEKARVELQKENLELPLFRALSRLIPPGGRIFVIYDSSYHRLTAQALRRGLPAAATPLGYLLWQSGFGWFKSWYFSEGWKEGSQKLQANKPINREHQQKQAKKLAGELRDFLSKKTVLSADHEKAWLRNAKRLIRELK